MNEHARLFFALWPNAATRAHLVRLQAPVIGRKVSPENLHLTLAFVGSQPKSLIPALTKLIDKLPGQSFTVGIDRYGYFKKPRIAWAGPSETPLPLVELHQRLMNELNAVQVPLKPEGKFTPHVTLARDAQSIDDPFGPAISWQVDRMLLIQSIPVRGGVIYSPIAARELA